jgi:membrane protein DedA with SNARE-associated domain
MSTLENLIRSYGYLAVFVGTFLEGETVLVLAGIAAHLGYLQFPLVLLAAFAGALSGDVLYFYLGRWHGMTTLNRHPQWQSRVAKLNKMMDRYHSPLILASRFLYGLRMITPFTLGLGHVPPLKYILLDAVSVLVWTLGVGLGGYLFGNFLDIIIGDIKRYELAVMGAVAGAGLLVGVIYYLRRRRSSD